MGMEKRPFKDLLADEQRDIVRKQQARMAQAYFAYVIGLMAQKELARRDATVH